MTIIPAKTPNFRVGRAGISIKAVVIHVTAAATAESTLAWFANPASEVSAHYLVDQDGNRIWQFVDEHDTAWHAGTYPHGREEILKDYPEFTWINPAINTNCQTIGIEHVGLPTDRWPGNLYQASAKLLADICKRWAIPLDRAHVVGHHEIYPPHSGCPGMCDLDVLINLARGYNGQ